MRVFLRSGRNLNCSANLFLAYSCACGHQKEKEEYKEGSSPSNQMNLYVFRVVMPTFYCLPSKPRNSGDWNMRNAPSQSSTAQNAIEYTNRE